MHPAVSGRLMDSHHARWNDRHQPQIHI